MTICLSTSQKLCSACLLFLTPLIVTFFLTILCAVHVLNIGYYNMYPDIPSVRVFKTDLNDIVFPISFKICLKLINDNNTRFRNLGYWNEWHYFIGQSKYDDRKIGWNGHTENGSAIGSVKEILSSVSIDWENIILALKVLTRDGMYVLRTKDFKWSRADYRGCKLLDLNHYLDMSQIVPTSIRFEFHQQENILVSLKIQDLTSPSRAWLRLNTFLVLACLPNCLLACLLACNCSS